MANSRAWLWNHDNPTKNKPKNNYKVQFSINLLLKNEIEKKFIKITKKNWLESTRLTRKTHDSRFESWDQKTLYKENWIKLWS